MRSLVLAVLMLVQSATLAAQYEDETVRLALPAGFEGPLVESLGPAGKTVAFVRALPDDPQRGTLLQITIVDTRAAGLSLPDSGQTPPVESLVAEFLAGLQRHRDRFEVISRSRLDLSGHPAARAEWRGTANGHGMHGVLYCVVVGSRVVSLHTQTFDDAPDDHLPAAVAAIEVVVLTP